MLFKNTKRVLMIIRKSKPQLPFGYYDQEDIWKSVQLKYLNEISEEAFRSALNNLSSENFITFSEKSSSNFLLNDKGRYYYQFILKRIRSYVLDKWIDLLALIIAVAALIVSIVSIVIAI